MHGAAAAGHVGQDGGWVSRGFGHHVGADAVDGADDFRELAHGETSCWKRWRYGEKQRLVGLYESMAALDGTGRRPAAQRRSHQRERHGRGDAIADMAMQE